MAWREQTDAEIAVLIGTAYQCRSHGRLASFVSAIDDDGSHEVVGVSRGRRFPWGKKIGEGRLPRRSMPGRRVRFVKTCFREGGPRSGSPGTRPRMDPCRLRRRPARPPGGVSARWPLEGRFGIVLSAPRRTDPCLQLSRTRRPDDPGRLGAIPRDPWAMSVSQDAPRRRLYSACADWMGRIRCGAPAGQGFRRTSSRASCSLIDRPVAGGRAVS